VSAFIIAGKPFRKQRAKVIPLAHGRVLEVGIGTGLNMPFYARSRIKSIVGVEPSMRMHHLALKRIQHAGIEVEFVGLSAEALPISDASFDTVVSTYTLCTIPDPVAALSEIPGVLVHAASSCSPSAAERQMRVFGGGKPACSPTGAGFQADACSTATSRLCLSKLASSPTCSLGTSPGQRCPYHYRGEAVAT
jgi:SAM-dependent methyltransferase